MTRSESTGDPSPEYGALATLGVAVPQASPTVEPELWTLVPDNVNVLATRLTGSRVDSRTRLLDYWESLRNGLEAFDNAKLDAVGFANTGSSYLIGREEEARRVDALSKSVGYPIVTAARAIRAALKSFRASRIALFSPYPDWLLAASVSYWQAEGIEIVDIRKVDKDTSDTRDVYGIRINDVIAGALQLRLDAADVVLFTGTGMPTLRAALAVAEATGKPVMSSNLCLAWALLKAANVRLPDPKHPECLIGGWKDRMKRWESSKPELEE